MFRNWMLNPVNKTKDVKDHCEIYLVPNFIITKDATKEYQEFQKFGKVLINKKKPSKIAVIFVFWLSFIGSLLFL